MAIKVYKPTINSRRNMSVIDYSGLSKVAPEKSLLAPLNKKAGRNKPAVTATAESRFVTEAAATEENIVSSTSSATSLMWRVP